MVTAMDYGVEHKFLPGSDFPSRTMENIVSGLRNMIGRWHAQTCRRYRQRCLSCLKKQPQNITDSRIAVSGMSPCCSELLAWPLSGRHRRQERILLRYYFSPSNIIKNVYRCTSVFVAYTARLAAWSKGVLPGARVRGIGQLGRAIEVRRRMGWQNLRVADLEAARAAQGPAGYWRLSFELMETNCRKRRSARLASHTFENARGR